MLQFFPDHFAVRFLQSAALIMTAFSCLIALRIHAGWLIYCIAVSGISVTLLLSLYFRQMYVALTDTEIFLHSGIFIRQERRMHLYHVRFVRHMYILGIRVLILYACGGRLVIPFLRTSDLHTLCRKLPEEVCHAP